MPSPTPTPTEYQPETTPYVERSTEAKETSSPPEMSCESENPQGSLSQDEANLENQPDNDAKVPSPRRRGRPRKQLRNPNPNSQQHQRGVCPTVDIETDIEADP